MTRDEARLMFSDLAENALDEEKKDALLAYLAQTPDAAAEYLGFSRTFCLLRRLPPEEPRLDLWAEFAPKMAEYQQTQRLGFVRRLTHKWQALRSDISAGIILWTHLVARRAQIGLERYLWHDSLFLDRSEP